MSEEEEEEYSSSEEESPVAVRVLVVMVGRSVMLSPHRAAHALAVPNPTQKMARKSSESWRLPVCDVLSKLLLLVRPSV